jgi:predicted alpha-1,2-mannosidase
VINSPSRSLKRTVHVGVLLACCVLSAAYAQRTLTPLINPFVGTAKHGHTYPGATVPFGMVQLSPDTRTEGWDACSGYHYSDTAILGFSHLHLSGTGVADYGDILLMPTVGALRVVQGDPARGIRGYWSKFRHADESASPGYYRVKLEDYGIQVELSATKRVGIHKYVFPKADSASIVIDLKHGLGPDKVEESSLQVVGDDEVVGFRRSQGWAKNQIIYFAAKFSRPFKSFGIVIDDVIRYQRRKASGDNLKGFVRFKTQANETILVKVGLSSVSIKGARKNLAAEIPGWDFEQVKAEADRAWNSELNRVWVDGGSERQRRTFYTALYHAMLTPNTFSDVDGEYRGMDGTIRRAEGFEMYTVFSLWDTFRAEHPLFTIIDQHRAKDFVRSLLQKYEEGGILPVWELASNETWCMIGYHAVPVILDAYVKGIRSFDAERALVAMKHSANLDQFGLKSYRANGYIAAEAESESVSKTLEYSYDDWCIAQFAGGLGKKQVNKEFGERGAFFRNLFDPATGFMRAKENARWVEPFDPRSVTVNYTEANAWQYSFFAPQDVAGMIQLHGGRESFERKLDQLFSEKEELIGRNQLDISGMIGQYAQGNEPSHHVAYLYDYAGAPWKTQQLVRRILDSLYTPDPDGLCGNDDCGQMSAWYVFGAMGFYPVTPGLPSYAIGSPLFERVTLRLENGRQFVVRSEGNSPTNRFIQSARLNNVQTTRTFIDHGDLMRGGTLEFVMGSQPNEQWGSNTADAPPSGATISTVSPPVLQASSAVFTDSLVVSMSCTTPGASIFHAILGTESSPEYLRYSAPTTLRESATIAFFAQSQSGERSKTIRASFTRFTPPGKITLHTAYSPQYAGGGETALIDGRRGSADFRLGAWQGYEGNDLEAVIDLGSVKSVGRVSLGCLQDNNSWIFFPAAVEVSFSSDGESFSNLRQVANTISPKEEGVRLKEFSLESPSVTARFVRVRAKNIGICPDWHKGAGNKAWLFVDEISLVTK